MNLLKVSGMDKGNWGNHDWESEVRGDAVVSGRGREAMAMLG